MRTTAFVTVASLLFTGFALMPTAAAGLEETIEVKATEVCHPGVSYYDRDTNTTYRYVNRGCVIIDGAVRTV